MHSPPPNLAPIPLKPIPSEKCTLGCPVLDDALSGGIPCGSITELVGECGCGKTQLALQLLLAAQLPPSRGGLAASSLYIHSEGYFASRRLQQLSHAFISHFKGIQSEFGNPGVNQCIGVQPELNRQQNSYLSESQGEWSQPLCNQPIGPEPHFGISPINGGLIPADRSSGGSLGHFVCLPELVQPQTNCFNGVQSGSCQVPLDGIIYSEAELGQFFSRQPNGALHKLNEFPFDHLVPDQPILDNKRDQNECDGAQPKLCDGAQPKLDEFRINESGGAQTGGFGRPWTHDFDCSHQIGVQFHVNQAIGSQPDMGYVEAQSELGQLPMMNCRLDQTNRCISASSMDYEDKRNCSSQQHLGKRKDGQYHHAVANGKRTCCQNNLDGDQDTEFWGAINSTEWQVLDSISKSHVPQPATEVNFSKIDEKSGTVNLDPCDNIFVQGVHTIEELLIFLDQIEVLLSRPLGMPVRLLVIDSVAALFRSDFDNTSNDLVRRASFFFRLSGKLKYYAEKFNIAVVVTNQVVDFINSEGSKGSMNDLQLGNFDCLVSSNRRVVPALGLSWAHCINTRLFLSRMGESTDSFDSLCNTSNRTLSDSSSVTALDAHSDFGKKTVKRKMHVVFAPHLPSISCDFVIERDGVRGI